MIGRRLAAATLALIVAWLEVRRLMIVGTVRNYRYHREADRAERMLDEARAARARGDRAAFDRIMPAAIAQADRSKRFY